MIYFTKKIEEKNLKNPCPNTVQLLFSPLAKKSGGDIDLHCPICHYDVDYDLGKGEDVSSIPSRCPHLEDNLF